MQNRFLLAAAVTLTAAVHPLAAQDRHVRADSSRAGWSLERTMREFIGALPGEPVGFFPSRGSWTLVRTSREPDGRDHASIHRFPAAQTEEAMRRGPACASFSAGDAARLGTIILPAVDMLGGEWHRVTATRFVPAGFAPSSPIFVEWRREDGRWVVSSYGEQGWYEPHLAGWEGGGVDPRHTYPLRLPLPPETPVAADADWYVRNEPIPVAGHRLVKYGLPRKLNEGDVVRFGRYRGVGLYAEPRVIGQPQVVYVPVDREGSFQSYQNETSTGCER